MVRPRAVGRCTKQRRNVAMAPPGAPGAHATGLLRFWATSRALDSWKMVARLLRSRAAVWLLSAVAGLRRPGATHLVKYDSRGPIPPEIYCAYYTTPIHSEKRRYPPVPSRQECLISKLPSNG